MSVPTTRVLRAGFWNDPEIARWPLPKRVFYIGLTATAEDSGVVEDDPFGWKIALFPSPVDSDITDEVLREWADEMIHDEKLVAFEANERHWLYLRSFASHQSPAHPRDNHLPLPVWVRKTITGEGQGKRVSYDHSDYRGWAHQNKDCTDSAQSLDSEQVGLGLDGSGRDNSDEVEDRRGGVRGGEQSDFAQLCDEYGSATATQAFANARMYADKCDPPRSVDTDLVAFHCQAIRDETGRCEATA